MPSMDFHQKVYFERKKTRACTDTDDMLRMIVRMMYGFADMGKILDIFIYLHIL